MEALSKNIALLGITGSIGLSTVDVVREHPGRFKISIASAHNRWKLLLELAQEFSIPVVVLTDATLEGKLTDIPAGTKVYYGPQALLDILRDADYDVLLNAIAGSPGLLYTMSALYRDKDVALANKESLVMAGHLINQQLRNSKARLLPVDSEHSAVFQAIGDQPKAAVKRIILTASGGAFRDFTPKQLENVTVAQALKHPTWNMGAKITIDSATMMNKGLEVIEAHWLFGVDYPNIEAVIHPQSVVHSLVEFVDGSLLAQLSSPSMKLPILYALAWPVRYKSNLVSTSLTDIGQLTFKPVQPGRYPLFELACQAGATGGLAPTIINAANEAAVKLFMQQKISFNAIYDVVANTLSKWPNQQNPSLETVIETNTQVYQQVLEG